MKILHTSDTHFSVKADKLEEAVNVGSFIVETARAHLPDLIVIAGDTVDEMDGPIRVDSPTYHAVVSFICALAEHAPVAIVTGTPSHDRRTPETFRWLKTRHAVYVANTHEVVYLSRNGEFSDKPADAKAALVFLPPPLVATFPTRESLLQRLASLTPKTDAPRIAIGHGAIQESRNVAAPMAGEHLYDVRMLRSLGCDYYAFGHIHEAEEVSPEIHYSGSPGRYTLNDMAPRYIKMVTLDRHVPHISLIETPARLFRVVDVDASSGPPVIDYGQMALSHARIRIRVPEERRHTIDRAAIRQQCLLAGAVDAAVDICVIPRTRQRAPGISARETLLAKALQWGETSDTRLTERTCRILSEIEGKDTDELIREALDEAGISEA